MSNTGRNKKLASFNCDEELWSAFMQRCQEQGTTATATLTQFIQLYLDGKLDNLDADMLGDDFGGTLYDHADARRLATASLTQTQQRFAIAPQQNLVRDVR